MDVDNIRGIRGAPIPDVQAKAIAIAIHKLGESHKKLEGLKKILGTIHVDRQAAGNAYRASMEARKGGLEKQAKNNNQAKEDIMHLLLTKMGDCADSEVSECDNICKEQREFL